MKISQLVICLVSLTLAGFAILYTVQQRTTMSMLINARGTSELAQGPGLKSEVSKLKGDAATAITERNDSLDKQRTALGMKEKAREAYMNARRVHLEAQKECLAARLERVEVEKALAQTIKEQNTMLAFLRAIPGMETIDSFESAVSVLPDVINRQVEEEKESSEQLAKVRKELGEESTATAREREERLALETQNDQFYQDNTKNEEEFVVAAVNPEWEIIHFRVGENSGLVAGDSMPLLVHRGTMAIATVRIVSIENGGEVTAKYNTADLPKGVRIEVGDKIARQRPVGN